MSSYRVMVRAEFLLSKALFTLVFFILVLFILTPVICLLSGSVYAQELGNRKELSRVDLSGAPGMEVISSISEFKPGEFIGRHYHHGVESGYFLQGALIQFPGQDPTSIPSGAPILNIRGVPHAGFKVIGDTPLKIYTVHIVNKGKPLYELVE